MSEVLKKEADMGYRMKYAIVYIILTCCSFLYGGGKNMEKNIKWLGHSTIRIEHEGKQIYIDPWKLKTGQPKADIILITHSHHDHCSPEDIEKIRGEKTLFIGPSDALEKIKEGEKKIMLPGENINTDWVTIDGVRSYNIDKKFHPKSNNWLGFILKFRGYSVYIAGDTDLIPEMKDIRADVAILPVGGTYTMDAKQAAEAVKMIKPKVAIPIHFGDIVGNVQDARIFDSLVKEAEVRILEVSK